MTKETKKADAKKAKKAGIPAMKFVTAVVAGRKENKSNAEIAKSLGMDADSFGVRLSNTNRDLRNATAKYTVNGEVLTGEQFAAKHKLKISELHKPEVLKKAEAVISTPGRTIPGSESVPRTRTNWSDMAASLFGEEAAEAGESSESTDESSESQE